MMNIETEQLDAEIRALTDRVIELGLYVEEVFKNSVSLLFSREWSGTYGLYQTQPDVAPVTLVSEAISIITRWAPATERMRTVVALQQASDEFGAMLSMMNDIATNALKIEDSIESYFKYLGPRGRDAFYRIIQSAHIQLRGCVMALSAHDATLAQHVIAQDAALNTAYQDFQAALQLAMLADAHLTMPFAMMSVITGHIEQMGNRISRICQRVIAISHGVAPDYATSRGA
jgi:phosphate uptake regulator